MTFPESKLGCSLIIEDLKYWRNEWSIILPGFCFDEKGRQLCSFCAFAFLSQSICKFVVLPVKETVGFVGRCEQHLLIYMPLVNIMICRRNFLEEFRLRTFGLENIKSANIGAGADSSVVEFVWYTGAPDSIANTKNGNKSKTG